MIRRSLALSVATMGLVVTTAVNTAATASAATSYARCTTQTVMSKAYTNIPVWSDTNTSSTIIGYYQRNDNAFCYKQPYARDGLLTAGRYNGCGATNANSWISIYDDYQQDWGFTYATCWTDI